MAARIRTGAQLTLGIVNPIRPSATMRRMRWCRHSSTVFTMGMDRLEPPALEMPTRLFASSEGRWAVLTGLELDAIDPGQFLFGDANRGADIRSLASVLSRCGR